MEIGCGTGRIGASIAKVANKWIGSDISGNMIDYSKTNLSSFTNVEFVELSGCNLKPIQTESVDKVSYSAVFMHLDMWDCYRYVLESFKIWPTITSAF